MTKFDLSDNALSGTLPTFAENLKLRHLDVSRNHLSGVVPQDTMKGAFGRSPGPFVLDLGFNQFEGTLPSFDTERLEISVVGNLLEGLDPEACEKELWNGGAVAKFGCDGLACPIGASNAEGRRTSDDDPCEPCPIASRYGNAGCGEDTEEEDHGGNGHSGNFGVVVVEEVIVEECETNCLNGGSCVESSAGPLCRCQHGFMGERCETIRTRPGHPGGSSFVQVHVSLTGCATFAFFH